MKYFCIGHNKCATSTLTTIFQRNGVSCHHGPMNWSLKDYNSFTDTGGIPFIDIDKKNEIVHHSTNIEQHFSLTYKNFDINNLIWLDQLFDDCIFIYNMRDLQGWMSSRMSHGIRLGGQKNQFYPTNDDMLLDWINLRNYYAQQVLNYFQNSKNSIVLIDTTQPHWINFLCEFLNFSHKNNFPPRNVTKEDKRPLLSKLCFFYQKHGITEKERSSIMPENLEGLSKTLPNNF